MKLSCLSLCLMHAQIKSLNSWYCQELYRSQLTYWVWYVVFVEYFEYKIIGTNWLSQSTTFWVKLKFEDGCCTWFQVLKHESKVIPDCQLEVDCVKYSTLTGVYKQLKPALFNTVPTVHMRCLIFMFIFKLLKIILCVGCLCAWIFDTMCVLGAHEGQKRATLELGLQMVGSFQEDDGNQTHVFCKNSQCS